MYRIDVAPAAQRDLEKLKNRIDRRDFTRLHDAMKSLSAEPRPQGVRKLKGEEKTYRVRAGNFRIVYEIKDTEKLVTLLHISRRNEATY